MQKATIGNRGSKNKKSDASRKQILDAAAKLFRRNGYAATTLRQIAAKAKMKAGSIYYHFDSKDEILGEVLDAGIHLVFSAVRNGIEALESGVSHRRKLEVAIAAHLYALLKYGDYTSANIRIYGQIPKAARLRHRELRKAYGAYWTRLLQDAREAGEIKPATNLKVLQLFLFGAMNSTVEWYDPKRGPIEDLAATLAGIVFEGVT